MWCLAFFGRIGPADETAKISGGIVKHLGRSPLEILGKRS